MGIGAAVASIGAAIAESAAAIGGVAAGLGAGAATAGAIGTGVVDAAIGAGLGAASSAAFGRDPGMGALGGAFTGGAIGGLGGALGSSLGSTVAGDVLAGSLGGSLGSLVTGNNVGLGALEGGAAGLASGALNGGFNELGSGAGTSAAASTGGIPGVSTPDLSQVSAIPGQPAAPSLDAATNTASMTVQSPKFDVALPQSGSAIPTTGDTAGSILGAQPSAGVPAPSLASATNAAAGTPGVGVDSSGNLSFTRGIPASTGPGVDTAGNLTFTGRVVPQTADVPPPQPSFLDRLSADPLGTLQTSVTNNPSLAVGALGLGVNALRANQMPAGFNQLSAEAKLLGQVGQNLSLDSLSKALPPGAQSQLDEASNSMKARVRQEYVKMGLQGSTMEQQALASVDQTIASQGFNIMQSLLQQGLSAEQASSMMLAQIMNAQVSQQNALTGTIGNFAGALAGKK